LCTAVNKWVCIQSQILQKGRRGGGRGRRKEEEEEEEEKKDRKGERETETERDTERDTDLKRTILSSFKTCPMSLWSFRTI